MMKRGHSTYLSKILDTCNLKRQPFSGSWSLCEPKGAGKFRRLPHHIRTNCTLAIGEFTLHIWRDTHVPKIPWTPGTTADANARKAELYQYAKVGSDGDDANDNSHIWTETFTFEAYDRGMELARLAAAIQLGHDLHDVQIIPSDLYAACTKLMRSRRAWYYTNRNKHDVLSGDGYSASVLHRYVCVPSFFETIPSLESCPYTNENVNILATLHQLDKLDSVGGKERISMVCCYTDEQTLRQRSKIARWCARSNVLHRFRIKGVWSCTFVDLHEYQWNRLRKRKKLGLRWKFTTSRPIVSCSEACSEATLSHQRAHDLG